ncbi:MAG: LacI family DNA-binding transcriptional regulator [Microcella sp.]
MTDRANSGDVATTPGTPGADGSPMPARPTLAQVAKRAGVSASTASLAFSGAGPVSEDTRERVLAAARELEYGGPDPRARSLRTGRSGIIAVVMEERIRDAFTDPMAIAMVDGLADEIGAAGYSLLLLTDSPDRDAGGLRDAPMDAAILFGCSTDLDPAVTVLGQRHVPLVGVETVARDGMSFVNSNDRDAVAESARLLRDLGHRRVGVITLPMDRERSRGPLTAERLAASQAYTGIERLAGVRGVFPEAPAVTASGSLIDEGMLAAATLLDAHPEITAIVAQSDLLAIGAIQAAEERGLTVPADLSVVGFDGARVDGLTTRVLTTLVQPIADKGRAAARLALAALGTDGAAADRTPGSREFTSVLRVGDTTGPASTR